MPVALPATTLTIYPGLGQAPNMLDSILIGVVLLTSSEKTKIRNWKK